MKKFYIMGIALAILIFLQVPCSAAVNRDEYNIIPSDIMQWTDYASDGDVSVGADDGNMVYMYSSNVPENAAGGQHISVVFKVTIPSGFLIPGQAYSILFTYPSDDEIIRLSRHDRTQSYINRNWQRVVVAFIGLAYVRDDGDYELLNGCSVTFDHEQSRQYNSGPNYINFVMPETLGKPLYFIVGYLRGGSDSVNNPTIYFGRYYGLFDFEKKKEIEDFNRMWYGNAEGDYSNPFTTENYDLGAASDTSELASAFDDFENGLDNLSAPFRITGRLLNDIFGHDSPLAIIGVIVFLVLILAVVFRLFGVT